MKGENMEETLYGLKRTLDNLAREINLKLNERQNYYDKANEIRIVYDRMCQDKNTIQSYRKSVNMFYRKSYVDFLGNNFKYTYKPEVKNLIDAYDIVIKNIDANLDALNNVKLSYETQAANCLGPLGILEASYNTVKTKIQNWTN